MSGREKMNSRNILKSLRLILSGAIVGIAIANVFGVDHNAIAGVLGAGSIAVALKAVPALL